MALHTAVAQAEVTFFDAIKIMQTITNGMLFSADNRVLIKLLKQKKKYGAKKCIAEFPSKPWTLSELNKRLPNTKHFML